jgi:hypothetical protein
MSDPILAFLPTVKSTSTYSFKHCTEVKFTKMKWRKEKKWWVEESCNQSEPIPDPGIHPAADNS